MSPMSQRTMNTRGPDPRPPSLHKPAIRNFKLQTMMRPLNSLNVVNGDQCLHSYPELWLHCIKAPKPTCTYRKPELHERVLRLHRFSVPYCQLACLSLKLEYSQEAVVSSTGDKALVFIPGQAFQMDIVGNSDL